MDERRFFSLQEDRWRPLDEDELLRRKQQEERSNMPAEFSVSDRAREIVVDHLNKEMAEADQGMSVIMADTYCVWSCWILGNWKALVSTDIPDGRYYEVTHDKDKGVTYLDVYQKNKNIVIPLV